MCGLLVGSSRIWCAPSSNGTTTLLAALSVLTGVVIGQCLPRHRNGEFLKFLRTIDHQVPKGLQIHLILDNYGTQTHDNVVAWLDKHPPFHLRFIPTSSSWLNMVERWFRELTETAVRRGVFTSVPDLIAAIEAYLQANNNNPKPFVWTATAEEILEKVSRGRVALASIPANNETPHQIPAYFMRAWRCKHSRRHEGDFGTAKHRRLAPARRHGVRLTCPTNSSLQVIR